jgi:two-component system, cell cycle response regulator DivK
LPSALSGATVGTMARSPTKGATERARVSRIVLVVEDEADEREMTVRSLRELGYVVEIATDGGQAVKQAQKHTPDVIVMDVALPFMTGIEALRHIRANATAKRPQVIMMSGQVDGRTRQLAFEAGCDQYIVKPCGVDTLAGAVQAYFAKRDG